MFLFLVSCVADTGLSEDISEPKPGEAEAISQAQDERRIADLDLCTVEEVRRDVERSLVGWKVYLAKGKPDARFDRLVVYKDENDTKSWIWLSPGEHQRWGDAYFEKVKREHHLRAMEIVGILFAIQQAGDVPSPLPAHHGMSAGASARSVEGMARPVLPRPGTPEPCWPIAATSRLA